MIISQKIGLAIIITFAVVLVLGMGTFMYYSWKYGVPSQSPDLVVPSGETFLSE